VIIRGTFNTLLRPGLIESIWDEDLRPHNRTGRFADYFDYVPDWVFYKPPPIRVYPHYDSLAEWIATPFWAIARIFWRNES